MKTSCLNFQNYESNILMSISLMVDAEIDQLEKNYDKKKINLETYIEVKKKYLESIQQFKLNIEEINNG